MPTIPANQIASVTPGVIAAGGSALDVIGLILTTNPRIPIGTIAEFSDDTDVGAYFGLSSAEYGYAPNYFLGFDNSNIKPSTMLMAQYNTTPVPAWLRGGSLATMTLAQLVALPAGTLTLVIDGTSETSANISLAGATSFSAAAGIIQAAFTAPGFAVTYDSVSSAFVFTNTVTGATSTIAYPSTDALATSLALTAVTGAVLSQGAAAATPGAFMSEIIDTNQDWVTFATLFDPDAATPGTNTNKLAFAAWNNAQGNEFAYIAWDSSLVAATATPAANCLRAQVNAFGYSGTMVLFAPDATKAVFVCGAAASIDFTELNGRITFAFKSQSGLIADVTSGSAAKNLIANGYSFYGAYGTRSASFVWLYNGTVSGPFVWFDSYIDQIWMNNGFQSAIMTLLAAVKSIPYNAAGYAMIEAALLDQITAAVNFGAIRAGVTLSSTQISQVNTAAGLNIAQTLQQQGWYLQVLDAAPTSRQARTSPPCTFWYMDGQSVQQINLASIELM